MASSEALTAEFIPQELIFGGESPEVEALRFLATLPSPGRAAGCAWGPDGPEHSGMAREQEGADATGGRAFTQGFVGNGARTCFLSHPPSPEEGLSGGVDGRPSRPF